ncbi:hypothetical protein GCM10010191_65650 [Actinomadura vinacea]|uniref:Uncharacterized protein n=1 Tax=Actinomadura vinacea TaxID=115336 RepID=A0ABN3JUR8_9ACTN
MQAKSRHAHLGSLGHYVRLGEETSARITAEHDPAALAERAHPDLVTPHPARTPLTCGLPLSGLLGLPPFGCWPGVACRCGR